MVFDIAKENELWAFNIIDMLCRLGVSHFFIAPGSRSSALSLAAASHPQCTSTMHFDERGLAFAAVGYGKAKNAPAGVIVTSGTAVGNLLPAIMEAHADNVPLILITADRPPELRDCGANQTTEQLSLFSEYVRWQVDVCCPDPSLPKTFLPSLLSHAVFKARQAPSGPVHLNCMFREPLHSLGSHVLKSFSQQDICRYVPSHTVCSAQQMEEIALQLKTYGRGIIMVSGIKTKEEVIAIEALAQKLMWPLFCDISCRLAHLATSPLYIPYYEDILGHIDQVECVLHFGGKMVSKKVSQWLYAKRPHILLVADHPARQDDQGIVSQRIFCSIKWFAKELLEKVSACNGEFLLTAKHLAKAAQQQIHDISCSDMSLGGPSLFIQLSKALSQGVDLFIGNSMPVRDADHFFHPESFDGQIILCRGVSGIDGNISLSYGAHIGAKRPLIAIMGDLTFMHDMNALTLLQRAPILLIVINNKGGGIFSNLPVAEKKEHFETHMALTHSFSFENLARFAGLKYHRAKNIEDIMCSLRDHVLLQRGGIVEIQTEREEETTMQQAMQKKIQEALCSQSLSMAT